MTRHEVRITMGEVPAPFAAVYRRRGMEPPAASSPYALAALWPYRFRSLHRAYAHTFGYFWLPCVLCGREYGGHEITDSIPDPTRGPGAGMTICPVCSAERNGGTP